MSREEGAVVRLERQHDRLAVLTLDNPPLNLFDQRMIEHLQNAVRAFLEKGGPGHAEFRGR